MQPRRVYAVCGTRLWVAATAVVIMGLQSGVPANAQCFQRGPVSGFSQETIGGEVTGATRLDGGQIEICSSSRGYGGTKDSLLGLVQDTSNEFELSVNVVSLDGLGQAGVEARVFRGTGSDPAQAVIRISVQEDAIGIGFAITSGARLVKSAAMESMGTAPVHVQLPVRIGVERHANRITTFYFEGQTRLDHLSLPVEPGSSLDASTYRVGMVHGADLVGQGQPRIGTGRFSDPVLAREQSVSPPRLSTVVENYQGTIDQPTTLTIYGIGLAQTQEVMVAGHEAVIIGSTENRLTVEVPPTGKPVRGDIVVRTPGGTSEIPNAFFSFGKGFIRCDCNGDGTVDLSDMIAMLNHLFLGGPPCACDESGDCNDDDERDLSDPISGLTFLFLNSQAVPPAPFPDPGTDSSVPMCGLEDQLPRITGISRTEIREGDEFSITGSGFSDTTRVVIPGARLEVIRSAPDSITLRAGMIIEGGVVGLGLIEDFAPDDPALCRPRNCSSTSLGPMSKLDEPVTLIPSGVPVLGVSTQAGERGPIILQLDRQSFDPTRPLEVTAILESPSIANVTPGGRATTFQLSPAKSFEECVVSLAERLHLELAGGGDLGEVCILPEKELGQVVLHPTDRFPASLPLSGKVSAAQLGPVGRCGPRQTHPVNDEREHGWCRFEELVEPCNGLPQFEWFIPLRYVKSKSNSLGGMPHPSNRSPHDKEIMYNWEAYCHVRRHRLWNLCALESLVGRGRTEIPDFPIGAWVTKTIWRSDAELPRVIDRTKLYSYVYSGDGKRYYLTAIHHTTRDLDGWFWYDAYPAVQFLEGGKGEFVRGIGGCGGTNVDAPGWTAGTVWENYFLCTNVTRTQPVSTTGVGGVGPTARENSAWCGNFEFATECPDVIDAANLVPADDCFSGDDTCLNCHAENSVVSVAGSTLGVDFLHSLKSAQPDPSHPCGGGGEGGPVRLSMHIQPIFDNNCSCHKHWLGPGLAYSNAVNHHASHHPTMVIVKPYDPSNSFLWRKITNTHLESGGSGCAMPYDCSDTPTPLAEWELNAIEEWINSGAPDN